MRKSDENWVEKLYKPTFNLDTFLQKALSLDEPRRSDKEIQADVPRSQDDFVSRSCQTDAQLWMQEDITLLRRAYANKFEDLKQKYSASGSAYDEEMQNLRAEMEEMRENWRSTQQQLEECQQELANEKGESARLRIAVEGLKRFSASQLAEADDARWIAQFERASSQQAFQDRLVALRRQQVENATDRARQVEATKRAATQVPSMFDLTKVYQFDEEVKVENRRLKKELLEAVSALQEYENAYKMLLKHVNNTKPVL